MPKTNLIDELNKVYNSELQQLEIKTVKLLTRISSKSEINTFIEFVSSHSVKILKLTLNDKYEDKIICIAHLLTGLTKNKNPVLETIVLAGTSVHDLTTADELVKAIALYPRLINLNLEVLFELQFAIVNALITQKIKLQSLTLSFTPPETYLLLIQFLESNPDNLQNLAISLNRQSSDIDLFTNALSKNTVLQGLSIRDLKFQISTLPIDNLYQLLRTIFNHPNLKIITLINCGIDDNLFNSFLECLAKNKHLEELDLSDNLITNQTLRHLASLLPQSNISRLVIDGNPLMKDTANSLTTLVQKLIDAKKGTTAIQCLPLYRVSMQPATPTILKTILNLVKRSPFWIAPISLQNPNAILQREINAAIFANVTNQQRQSAQLLSTLATLKYKEEQGEAIHSKSSADPFLQRIYRLFGQPKNQTIGVKHDLSEDEIAQKKPRI